MRLKLLIILLFLKTILCFIFCNVILGQQVAVWPLSNDTSPFADVATSPFGPRDKNDSPSVFEYDYHGGLDLQAAVGTSVHAIVSGSVAEARWQAGAGNYVRIYHAMYFSEYYHLDTFFVSKDDDISTGDIIGEAGETGECDGPHLHLGIFAGNDIEADKKDKLNPVKTLNYTNTWVPSIITCDLCGSNFIDSMVVEAETKHDELDLNIIEVYLHKAYVGGLKTRKIEMIFDEQINVDNASGIFTHFGGTTFETDVHIRPQDFDAGWPQVIKIVVVPYDNTGFPKEYDASGQPKWMGIRFLDLYSKADSWGNIYEGPFLPVLNSFTAFPLEKEIKIIWSIGRCSEAVGINLCRSTFKNAGFVKINGALINIVNSDSQVISEYTFVDRDVLPGMEYFYKLE